MAEFKKGDRVEWDSHGGTAVGTVERRITERTEAGGRTVAASEDELQYLVKSGVPGGPPSTSRRRCDGPVGLHPEDAVARLQRRVRAGGERLGEDVAGVARVDHAVVPQAGGGVDGAALVLVLVAQAARRPRPGRPPSCTAPACSPPITEIRALGHMKRKRGE